MQHLLDKKMTRREFLGVVGIGLLSALGFASFFKTVPTPGGKPDPEKYNYGKYNG